MTLTLRGGEFGRISKRGNGGYYKGNNKWKMLRKLRHCGRAYKMPHSLNKAIPIPLKTKHRKFSTRMPFVLVKVTYVMLVAEFTYLLNKVTYKYPNRKNKYYVPPPGYFFAEESSSESHFTNYCLYFLFHLAPSSCISSLPYRLV